MGSLGSFAQGTLQAPQFSRSVLTFTQRSSPSDEQIAIGSSHGTHCPLRQYWAAPHVLPQAPQLLRSVSTMTHLPSQQSPPLQCRAHAFFLFFFFFLLFFFLPAVWSNGSVANAAAKARLPTPSPSCRREDADPNVRAMASNLLPSTAMLPECRAMRRKIG